MNEHELPLDEAALALLERLPYNDSEEKMIRTLVAQARAALALSARVVELEAEARGYWRCMNEQTATANALRDALEKHPQPAEWNELTGEYDLPHGSVVPCPLCAALASTPDSSGVSR